MNNNQTQELEKEFEQLLESKESEINTLLKEAREKLNQAEKLADSCGLNFRFGGRTYVSEIPTQYKQIPDCIDILEGFDSRFKEETGWVSSSYFC